MGQQSKLDSFSYGQLLLEIRAFHSLASSLWIETFKFSDRIMIANTITSCYKDFENYFQMGMICISRLKSRSNFELIDVRNGESSYKSHLFYCLLSYR